MQHVKVLGKMSYFLGVQLEHKGEEIKMNHKQYILKVLERFGMSEVYDPHHVSKMGGCQKQGW